MIKGEPMNKQYAAFVAAMTVSAFAQAADGGWSVYGGADYVMHEISITVTEPLPDGAIEGARAQPKRIDGDGNSTRLRLGLWLGEDFAVEVQTALSSDGVGAPDVGEIESYYGVFISPRAQPFDWLDVLFPIGYSKIDSAVPDGEGGKFSNSSSGVSYGLNFQVRLGEMLTDPDSIWAGLGVGVGFMVYDSSKNTNVRGYNAGLQFGLDF
jgi:hypothetical protein